MRSYANGITGRIHFVFVFVLFLASAQASHQLRWTQGDPMDLSAIVGEINKRTGEKYVEGDFRLLESRRLATSLFETHIQLIGDVPVKNRNLRIWRDPTTEKIIQVEASLEDKASTNKWIKRLSANGLKPHQLMGRLTSQKTMELVRKYLKTQSDPLLLSVNWVDSWHSQENVSQDGVDRKDIGQKSVGLMVREVTVQSRRGEHVLKIQLEGHEIIGSDYQPYPRSDWQVSIYPVYEESQSLKRQERVISTLKNLVALRPDTQRDPYEKLRKKRYLEDKLDPVLGQISQYQELGYWSNVDLKNKALEIISQLPMVENNFENGLRLIGKYATVALHPEVKKLPGINFELSPSAQYKPIWFEDLTVDPSVWEMIPGGSILGQPARNAEELFLRNADRLSDHNPISYINSGFDEIQMYWAMDTFMTGLHAMGFNDPELSTRSFHAFLFDPDLASQDNAYYTDDTINFTTYTPQSQNLARDNSTIWHELGHGIMDRLMGDYIHLADTGGLSEGMADFLAELMVEWVTGGVAFEGKDEFRINNNIGFYLTNEVHDDGEAYGGTLKDLLDLSVSQMGKTGLIKVTDLTLEAMRLSRNHPALTAKDWFEHMLYSDELGGLNREPGEMKSILMAALQGRNYRFDGGEPASFKLFNNDQEISDRGPGSRAQPILHVVPEKDLVEHTLEVKLSSSDTYKFKYPVKVRVQLEKGPLQGAIKWVGEENQFLDYVIESEDQNLKFKLGAQGLCQVSNRDDGSCVDFAWVQIWNAGAETKPVAKKRFYLRIKSLSAPM